MIQTKVFRLSGCLVALGFCLLIPAFIGLVSIGGCVAITTIGTGAAAVAVSQSAITNAASQLSSIDGVPLEYIRLFETNQIAAKRGISELPEPTQEPVRKILLDYNAQKAGTAIATGMFATFGTVIVIGCFFASIPVLIVGFLLVMRKKVWLCLSCGFNFDRA